MYSEWHYNLIRPPLDKINGASLIRHSLSLVDGCQLWIVRDEIYFRLGFSAKNKSWILLQKSISDLVVKCYLPGPGLGVLTGQRTSSSRLMPSSTLHRCSSLCLWSSFVVRPVPTRWKAARKLTELRWSRLGFSDSISSGNFAGSG